MPIPLVELRPQSVASHLLPIFTGFLMLHRDGRVRARQRPQPSRAPYSGPGHLHDIHDSQLRVVLDGRVRIHYDTHDSWEILDEYLDEADFYFKRSYAPEKLAYLGERGDRIQPLGLNWAVYPDGVDWPGLRRNLVFASGARRVYEVARALTLFDGWFFTPRLGRMMAPPRIDQQPRVLFLTRTFDPAEDLGLSSEKIEEREAINDSRARCIAALRRALGSRFYGGFVHTPHAVSRYHEFLAPEPDWYSKGKYIDLMKSFPICVATTGIHDSIGWKFTEYVACSKAIVSERLNYRVPGDLAAGRNYLEFDSVDGCVEQAGRLLDDRDLRVAMMTRNADYYERYVRPDSQVMATIERARG